MTFRAAFFKGEGNAFNGLIRYWDGGKYSHCELVFSDGLWTASTYQDNVRGAYRTVLPEEWDYIELPASMEAQARDFFNQTNGAPYDLIGQLRFFFSPYKGSANGYWCSEWVAAALGMSESYRYTPNGLHAVLSFMAQK
jgi:hypothetical protein